MTRFTKVEVSTRRIMYRSSTAVNMVVAAVVLWDDSSNIITNNNTNNNTTPTTINIKFMDTFRAKGNELFYFTLSTTQSN